MSNTNKASFEVTKTDARDSRLSSRVKKTEEEVLRNELKSLATDKCKPEFHAFGDCAKANGILVVFKCREENKLISSCLDKHYNEPAFRAFMGTKGFVWESKGSNDSEGTFYRTAN